MISFLLLLIGCNSGYDLNSSEDTYATKNKALQAFIETNNIQGAVVDITTSTNKNFLLSEYRDQIFL